MALVIVESLDAENMSARVRHVAGDRHCAVDVIDAYVGEDVAPGALALVRGEDLVVAVGGAVEAVEVECHKDKFRFVSELDRNRNGNRQWLRSDFGAGNAESAARLCELSRTGRCLLVTHPELEGGSTLTWILDGELSLPDYESLQQELKTAAEDETKATAAAAQKAAAEARAREAEQQARKRPTADHVFVNPYSFVPLPTSAAERRAPAGHAFLAPDRLSGAMTIAWTTLTPLLQRGAAAGEGGGIHPPLDAHGNPIVPGSSLKGAVRSLHETLTGSCLRVIDLAFVPSYRDQVTSGSRSGWVLGLIHDVDRDGRPIKVQLSSPAAWISAGTLGPGLKPGDRFSITGTASHNTFFNRLQFDESASAEPSIHHDPVVGEYIVLTTDASARPTHKDYSCAVGALTARTQEVPIGVWETYLRAVDGARGVDDNDGERVLVAVDHPAIEDATSLTPGRRMAAGQVIWVRPNSANTAIEQISLAAVWRSTGTGALGTRIGQGFEPCSDPSNLCPSCRIFGAADTGGAAEDAEQRSYRGHVRFSDARTSTPIDLEEVTLAPMGQPRPGAGQFYLNNFDRPLKAPAPLDRHSAKPSPYRQWGSDADKRTIAGKAPEPRRIAGRKFYWSAGPAGRQPRHIARTHQKNEQMVGAAKLVPAASTFTATLHFENLSRSELGGLLMALSPSLAWEGEPPIDPEPATSRRFNGDGECETLASDPNGGHQPAATPQRASADGEYATRLGGGKPLGLGIVSPKILDLKVHRARGRYLPADGSTGETAATAHDYVGEFVESVPTEIRQVWPDVAAMLHTGHVNPERIWYPPATTWDKVGSEPFDKSFEFFQQRDGSYLAGHEMATLRAPREFDQYLDIHVAKPGGRN